jgi:hypothetical protein
MQSIEAAHGRRSVMASGPDDRRLYYKKKTMATKITIEINLVHPYVGQSHFVRARWD